MALRNLISVRSFHATRHLFKSLLSDNYKSKQLWDERLKCSYLSSNNSLLSSINDKIVIGDDLNNVELDVFINIATPAQGETAQLRESIVLLNKIRRSLYADTILPSTHHALCRLFLYSQHIPSLVHVLENRVEYGVFPDLYITNILVDEALDKNNLVLACKLSSLVMLQEEFGLNPITDSIAALSVIKYISTKTDFSDWKDHDITDDKVFEVDSLTTEEPSVKEEDSETKKKEEDDEDDGEEDAEYIRIPFLRNSYDDQHFDLKNPRLICGKTLRLVSPCLSKEDKYIGDILSLFASILEGDWSRASSCIENISSSKQKLPVGWKEIVDFYLENLNEISPPSDDLKQSIALALASLEEDSRSLSHKLENMVQSGIKNDEQKDIAQLRNLFNSSSELRSHYEKLRQDKEKRDKLIAEIKAKREELVAEEQYLYFYDNLEKSTLTKIEYK